MCVHFYLRQAAQIYLQKLPQGLCENPQDYEQDRLTKRSILQHLVLSCVDA